MNQPVTSWVLIGLTLISATASVVSWYRLRRGVVYQAVPGNREDGQNARANATDRSTDNQPRPAHRLHLALVGILMVGSAGVLIGRWLESGAWWEPLHAHVDGLVLIAALLAAVVLYVLIKPGWFGISAFALPLLTFILSWAICASAWTYRPFHFQSITPVWTALHLVGVYLGTLFAAISAVAGGMYLYVQWRLNPKVTKTKPKVGPLASLESLEAVVVRSATGGFVLLSLGLIAGIVVVAEDPQTLWPGWWYGPKIILAVIVWGVYALLINVRSASTFRGARAAWLAIAGLVLLLATYGIITAMPSNQTLARGHDVSAGTVNVHEDMVSRRGQVAKWPRGQGWRIVTLNTRPLGPRAPGPFPFTKGGASCDYS